jgi:hypothetical protein
MLVVLRRTQQANQISSVLQAQSDRAVKLHVHVGYRWS